MTFAKKNWIVFEAPSTSSTGGGGSGGKHSGGPMPSSAAAMPMRVPIKVQVRVDMDGRAAGATPWPKERKSPASKPTKGSSPPPSRRRKKTGRVRNAPKGANCATRIGPDKPPPGASPCQG